MSECRAELYLWADFTDNYATIRCQLEEGHEGRHLEECRDDEVSIYWVKDEREVSDE